MALETHEPIHRLAGSFVPIVAAEARRFGGAVRSNGALTWSLFLIPGSVWSGRWCLGERPATPMSDTDPEPASFMGQLGLSLPTTGSLARGTDGEDSRLPASGPPGKPSGVIADPVTGRTAPQQQVPPWLFAFEARAMATFRGLALLASRRKMPITSARRSPARPAHLPAISSRRHPRVFLAMAHHATLVLRESTAPTEWGSIENAYRNGYSIFGPRWPGAAFCQSIRPTASAGRQRATKPAAYPVPPGPAACPERELLLLSTTMRSALLVDWQWELKRPTRIESDKPLPGTLSHGGLHFERQGL